MFRKRGQETAGGAAALVAIITLLIILYILFVPPGERERILGVNETEEAEDGERNVSEEVEINKTLLEVQPGKIFYLPQKVIEHELPSINLYTKTEGMVVRELDSLAVKKALFTEKKQNMTFVLDHPEHTSNVLLSFNVLKASTGELIIKLNGKEVFNKEIEGIVEPVKLNRELLKAENVLEFEASGVGMVFWRVHEFSLENIKVTADITEMAASESKSIFLVSRTEKDNLDKASIRFASGCQREEVGRLFVEINGYDVFTGVPDCGQIRSYQFSPEKLMQGENIVRFRTEKGHYLLDRIMVKTELTEPEQYIWFFQLSDAEYDEVIEDDVKINLTVEFPDDSYKEGYFVINGHETGFSTRELTDSRIINPFVRRGGNAIKLDPGNNMFITDLRVVIE
ncbi:hypothetical protein KY345_04410 [Candidatus Woesearchaeota archaeon]|nr:hypothetical protein [Candidatus Woesearchaeota archaeon]